MLLLVASNILNEQTNKEKTPTKQSTVLDTDDMRATEGLAVFNGEVKMDTRPFDRKCFHISFDEAIKIRQTRNRNIKGDKPKRLSPELRRLIREQQKELKLENKTVFGKSPKNDFGQSRKGVFVNSYRQSG